MRCSPRFGTGETRKEMRSVPFVSRGLNAGGTCDAVFREFLPYWGQPSSGQLVPGIRRTWRRLSRLEISTATLLARHQTRSEWLIGVHHIGNTIPVHIPNGWSRDSLRAARVGGRERRSDRAPIRGKSVRRAEVRVAQWFQHHESMGESTIRQIFRGLWFGRFQSPGPRFTSMVTIRCKITLALLSCGM